MKAPTYTGTALDEMTRKGGGMQRYRIQPYFNNTFPATRAERDALVLIHGHEGFQRHIEHTFATRGDPFFDGWREGDPLLRSMLVFDGKFRAPIDAANYAFAQMNHDDRENGLKERSLSVGDVVHVEEVLDDGSRGVSFWLAVEPVGFRSDLNSIGIGPDGINVIEKEAANGQ